MGLSENEYLDIVEHIQQAMCVEPFRPNVADVVALIGAWQVLNREGERLRTALNKHHKFGYEVVSGTDCWCQTCGTTWQT